MLYRAYIAKGERRKIKHVHRLDRDTTGAILFAKHALAGSILDKTLEERSIKRTYFALVHGQLKRKKGTIQEPIGRDRHHPTKRRVSASGQPAITHYELLEYNSKQNLSLIQCQLDTGRTHQIRVHLSSIGHPIVGDKLYGGKPLFERQALHAGKLVIPHPFTSAIRIRMAITTPPYIGMVILIFVPFCGEVCRTNSPFKLSVRSFILFKPSEGIRPCFPS